MRPNPALSRFLLGAAGAAAIVTITSDLRAPALTLSIAAPSFQLRLSL